MKSYRFAAIDIGSNAVRLLVTDINETAQGIKYKKRAFVRVPLRLGEDAFLTHRIKNDKISALQSALQSFFTLIKLYKADDYLACATSALRDAENSADVITRLYRETGIKVQVITGKREAEIIYTNHIAEELNHNKSYMYIDVGGGSTELTLFSQKKISASASFPIGAIRLLHNQVSEETWKEMKSWVKEKTDKISPLIGIGTGGNINKIFKLIKAKEGKLITYNQIREMHDELDAHTTEERVELFELNEDRADVIVPAAKIFLQVMKWANISDMVVPKLGLSDGIIHLLYERRIHAEVQA